MKWPVSSLRIARSLSDLVRLLLLVGLSSSLFAQPERFILPPSSSVITPATQEPLTTLPAINTRNFPAVFFQNAEGTEYYSIVRSATDTLFVLAANNPGVALQRLNLSVATAAVLAPDRRRLLIVGASGLHVIDTTTDAAVAKIPVAAPIDLAASSDGRLGYVLSTQLLFIDLATNTVLASLSLAAGASAVAVCHTGLVYVSAPSRLYEINGGTGQLLREIPVPGSPGRLILTPNARTTLAVNRAYASSAQTQAVYEVTVAPLRFNLL